MAESAPAPAAPNENAAPEEIAVEKEAVHGRRWRLHVPTSVLVTLLVAAVSVWLAPAFTRQWEDRKQARQLQAQVAEDVALATADLGQRINSLAVSNKSGIGISNERQAVKDYWQIRQARIDARLRAYFSQETRAVWLEFNELVENVIELVKTAKYSETGDPGGVLRRASADRLREISRLGRALGVAPPFAGNPRPVDVLITNSLGMRRPLIRQLVVWMRGTEDKIIDRVMTEDPEAFSTTRRDLLRDLLP